MYNEYNNNNGNSTRITNNQNYKPMTQNYQSALHQQFEKYQQDQQQNNPQVYDINTGGSNKGKISVQTALKTNTTKYNNYQNMGNNSPSSQGKSSYHFQQKFSNYASNQQQSKIDLTSQIQQINNNNNNNNPNFYGQSEKSNMSSNNFEQNSSSNNNSNMQTMDEKTPITTINCYNNNEQQKTNVSNGSHHNTSINLTSQNSTNSNYQTATTNNNQQKYSVGGTYNQYNYVSQNPAAQGKSPNIKNSPEYQYKKLTLSKKSSYYDQRNVYGDKGQSPLQRKKTGLNYSPNRRIDQQQQQPGNNNNNYHEEGCSPSRPNKSLINQASNFQSKQSSYQSAGGQNYNTITPGSKQNNYQVYSSSSNKMGHSGKKSSQSKSKEKNFFQQQGTQFSQQKPEKSKRSSKLHVANEKFTKKLIIDLNSNNNGSSSNNNHHQGSSQYNNRSDSNGKKQQGSYQFTLTGNRYRDSSLDNSFTRKPTYNQSFRNQSKSPLRYQRSHLFKDKGDKNSSFSVNNSLNNSEFNSSQDNTKTLTSSFSRLCLKSKNYGKSPNSHREILKSGSKDNYILNQLNQNESGVKKNSSVNKFGASKFVNTSGLVNKRSSTPNNKINLNQSSLGKLKTDTFQNSSIQNSKYTSNSRVSLSKTQYNTKFKNNGRKSSQKPYDKNFLLDQLTNEEESQIQQAGTQKPGAKQNTLGQSPPRTTPQHIKTNTLQYNFEINTSKFPNLQLNMEEIKKDRQRLIRKIQATFKVKNKAPSTSQEFYKILHVVGKGAFAKVCLGIQLLTGKFVAIKLIDKSMLRSEGAKNRVLQEVLILKKLSGNKNIIKLLEVFENRKLIFIITEYINGNDLMQIMKQREGKPFSEPEVQQMLMQIMYALKHCQKNNVLHRDIKLDNLLLDKDSNIKMIDFGISRVIHPGQRMTEQCGTPAFLAPEIIANKGYEGFGSDLWSLGILLYILLYGRVPFKGNNLNELHRNIMNGVLPEDEMSNHGVSMEAQDLLKKILVVNVRERINFDGIINHPWLAYSQGIDQDAINDNNSNNNNKYIKEDYVSFIESFGYGRDYIYRCLEKNGLSHVNALYHLLQNQ